MFEHKKIFILGMARSGYEVAKLLSQYSNQIIITDIKEQDPSHIEELHNLGISFILTDSPEELLDETFDCIVKNPGIRRDHKCIVKARSLDIPIVNEVEVAYHLLPDDIKIIAITGSNGKTTTTTMSYEVLKRAGLPVHLGGNIGYPVSSLVSRVHSGDTLVLEISDHQLVDTIDFHPHIAALLNLAEAHIDFHGDYETYKTSKKKIFCTQTSSDIAVLNRENQDVIDLTNDIESTKLYFSSKRDSDCCIIDDSIFYKGDFVVKISDIKLQGIHNYENIMAMIAIVKQLNVDNVVIRSYLEEFGGVAHRIEYVRKWHGIDFYNDSKSTNVDATITALNSFTQPVILLLGGLDRGHSFEPLNQYIENVKLIVAYGETKNRIASWAKTQNKECITADTLAFATEIASTHALEREVVLLSPACASWDQYACFEDRGNEFKNIINAYL